MPHFYPQFFTGTLRTWLIICFVHFSLFLQGQNPPHDFLTTEDGLPSDEIYQTYQDSCGNLWFCTDNGLARTNGKSFTYFNVENGLPGNTIFKIFPGPSGQLWFTSFSNGVFYIERDSIIVPAFNESMKKELGSNFIRFLDFGPGDSIFLSCSYEPEDLFQGRISDSTLQHIPSHFPPVTMPKLKKHYTFQEVGTGHSCFITQLLALVKAAHHSALFLDPKGKNHWISLYNQLFRIDFEKKEINWAYSLDFEITAIYYEDQQIMLGSYKHGISIYDLNDNHQLKLQRKIFSNVQTSFIYRDREGTFWISTIGEGVIRVPNLKQVSYRLPIRFQSNAMAFPFHFSGDTIRIFEPGSVDNSELNFQPFSNHPQQAGLTSQRQGRDFSRTLSSEVKSYLHTLVPDNLELATINTRITKGVISHWIGWRGKYFMTTLNKICFLPDSLPLQKQSHWSFLRDSTNKNLRHKRIQISGSSIIFAGSNGFLDILNDTIAFDSRKYYQDNNVRAVLKEEQDHYWAGSHTGLTEFHHNQIIDWKSRHPSLRHRIEDIVMDSRGIKYVGTRGAGLAILYGDTVFSISTENGLTNNQVTRVIMLHDTTWIATKNGLNRLILDTNLSFSIDHSWLNGWSGFNAIEDLAFDGQRLAIVQKDRITYIDPSSKQEITPSEVLLEQVWSSGDPKPIDELLSIYNQQNQVVFFFRLKGMLNNPFIQYQYRLLGHDDRWVATKNNQVSFPDLPYGSYQFEVRVINASGQVSSAKSFSFQVVRPITATLGFQISLAVILTVLVFLGFWWIFKRRQHRVVREKALLNSNLFALKMQMNPHLIFNSLNSIQYYIASNEKRQANIFLKRFSDMIREMLYHSHQSKILLQQEIERAKNYLELENMRFDGHFDWEIKVAENVDTKWPFPSMVIQPVLENAVWHGINELPFRGKVSIEIDRKDDYLSCKITDNGRGIDLKKLQEIEILPHKGQSVGINNVRKRLELLSRIEHKKYQLSFHHPHPKKLYKGTEAQFLIPLTPLKTLNHEMSYH